MDYACQKFTPLNEFRTLFLNAINHDKMALCIIHHCSISLHEVVHHTHQPPTHHPDLTYAPSSYEGPGSSKFEIGTVWRAVLVAIAQSLKITFFLISPTPTLATGRR